MDLWQAHSMVLYFPLLVGNIRLNWMFCLASSHSHTTKYDLHSHFTDETTSHEENRHRRWRFWRFPETGESPWWLCCVHCKSLLLLSQPELFVSIHFVHRNLTSYDETTLEIQVHRWITLHQLGNNARIVCGFDRLSSRTVCLTCRITLSVKRKETCDTCVARHGEDAMTVSKSTFT